MLAIPAEFFFFVGLLDFRRRHGLCEGQREGVSVVGRCLAALLHVGLAFEHQQVAPVDVVARARQVQRASFSSSWIAPCGR
jgi:hypothetical protein